MGVVRRNPRYDGSRHRRPENDIGDARTGVRSRSRSAGRANREGARGYAGRWREGREGQRYLGTFFVLARKMTPLSRRTRASTKRSRIWTMTPRFLTTIGAIGPRL